MRRVTVAVLFVMSACGPEAQTPESAKTGPVKIQKSPVIVDDVAGERTRLYSGPLPPSR